MGSGNKMGRFQNAGDSDFCGGAVSLAGVHLTGVHLTGVHLTGVHLRGRRTLHTNRTSHSVRWGVVWHRVG
jgi:hypothetical protein